jgi:ketosteroid isomerase-like protein
MLDKAIILRTIDEAYATRAKGKKEELAKFWAPNASYRLVGADLPPPVPTGSSDPLESVNTLIDLFTFDKHERLDAIVEGNMAAVHWTSEVSTPSGRSAKTELYDLWKFNADGKAISLLQFADTALLERLVRSN